MDRRLTRSRQAMVGGVAAGVAEWINADTALVRIAWAILVPLTGGFALLAYIVAWVVIPEAPRRPDATAAGTVAGSEGEAMPSGSAVDETPDVASGDRTALFIGGGLIVVGLWFLVREYLPEIRWNLVWPVVLVAIGVLILVVSQRRR